MDQERYDKIFNRLRTENLPFLSFSDKNYPRYVVKDGLLYYKPNWRNSRKVCNVLVSVSFIAVARVPVVEIKF